MSPSQISPVGRIEKILLPTDGSEYSAGAERVAIAMCRHAGAKLLALRVIIRSTDLGFLAPETDTRLEQEAIEQIDQVRQRAKEAGIACNTNVRDGDDPYKVIVEESKDTQADLIVMGRRGRRGLARLMLGDATAKVIGYAPCSVMVVPKAAQMWEHVLLATDGSRSSDAAAVTAARIAKCCGTPLTVLSVMVPSHSERRQAEAQPIVERIVKLLAEDGIAAEGVVEKGMADEVIIDFANRKANGLIILGSHGRTGIGRVLFGSKAERVINHANCPVLVVKGA
jgi:nucleotide-binding universal stress UspA family protein